MQRLPVTSELKKSSSTWGCTDHFGTNTSTNTENTCCCYFLPDCG